MAGVRQVAGYWNFSAGCRFVERTNSDIGETQMWIGSRSGLAVAALWLALLPAQAQQNPMDNPSVVQPKGEKTDKSEKPPMAGANSFSEGQARDLIESKGYANVSALMNDGQGIWRGTASKGAAKVSVSVDYKGNVTAGQE